MSRSGCATETRVGDDRASIRWCAECGDFHLTLGHVQISLTGNQFIHLHSLINQAMQRASSQERQSQGNQAADLKPRVH